MHNIYLSTNTTWTHILKKQNKPWHFYYCFQKQTKTQRYLWDLHFYKQRQLTKMLQPNQLWKLNLHGNMALYGSLELFPAITVIFSVLCFEVSKDQCGFLPNIFKGFAWGLFQMEKHMGLWRQSTVFLWGWWDWLFFNPVDGCLSWKCNSVGGCPYHKCSPVGMLCSNGLLWVVEV